SAVLLADQHAIAALVHVDLDRAIVIEYVAGEPGAARQRHDTALKADQPARRNAILQAHAAAAVGHHVLHVAFTPAQLFHHRALIGVFDVYGQQFVRFLLHAVDFLHHHARTADAQLVAFAAHV